MTTDPSPDTERFETGLCPYNADLFHPCCQGTTKTQSLFVPKQQQTTILWSETKTTTTDLQLVPKLCESTWKGKGRGCETLCRPLSTSKEYRELSVFIGINQKSTLDRIKVPGEVDC